jgi:hypothetical protein
MSNVDYLCFDSLNFIFQAACLQSNGEKIQVIWEIFCGWWKNILFKYVHTSIKFLINLKYYPFVSCSFFAFMQVCHIL